MEATEHLKPYAVYCNILFHRLREERHGVGDAPGQGVRRTQGRRHPGEIDWKVCLVTEANGPFEQGESLGQVALAEGQ